MVLHNYIGQHFAVPPLHLFLKTIRFDPCILTFALLGSAILAIFCYHQVGAHKWLSSLPYCALQFKGSNSSVSVLVSI